MADTRSTCPYCGVGCGVIIESEGAQITGVRGDPDHPANAGRLCSKGSTLHLTATAEVTLQTRLLRPMLRRQRGAAAQPVSWNEAMTHATDTFERIVRTHGPDAVGFYISGQLLTEDYYVFNKLAKGLVGTNNIDTNSRLCMSSAVAGYKATLGADAPPACYDDLGLARTLYISGSNPAWAHPILFRRIEDARRADPLMRVIVVDPRRTDTADAADLHLPLLPGTDVALSHGLLHVILWEGWTDDAHIAAHTSGFAALKARVRDATPRETARVTGLKEDAIVQAARWFAGLDGGGPRTPTLSLYCQGLNQSRQGTANNAALVNLHLATGQIGKPGAGPFSLTGQPNAMGGREVGGMANLLSAHRDLGNPAHRAEVARLWGVPDVPARPGKTAVEMFEAAADGELRALWIACTNPAQSMPDQATVRRALERAEFVVLQEAYATTATAARADLLLPAATWGEKDGTVTNSERRISRVRAAVAPPGEARTDLAIATEFAQRLEGRLRPGQRSRFAYRDAEAVWNEHRESTRGRDLDITGLSYARLEADGPQQWPVPSDAPQGTARLYTDGRYATADGRARFHDTAPQASAEPREPRYPFGLNTGRLRDHWHGGSRTGTLGRLFGHAAEPSIDLHPQELQRLKLVPGDLVHVTSRRGSIVLPVQADDRVAPAQAFIAMHWGEEFVTGGVNTLTLSARCPTSQQPELKHCAIKVLKADLPWRLAAAAWLPADRVHVVRRELAALLGGFDFAACVPFGREHDGVYFRAASYTSPAVESLQRIESLLGLTGGALLHYEDRQRAQRRTLRLDNGTLRGFLLAGDASAEAWIKDLLQQELPAAAFGRALLFPGPTPPAALAPAGRQICTCFDVREPKIVAALRVMEGTDDERLDALQSMLHCGTNCGSCLPELQRLVRTTSATVTA